MSFHPAFPTAADLSREAQAITRDLEDLNALKKLRTIVSRALDAAGQVERIRHPDRRWTTEDLIDALTGQLTDIDDTAAMIRRSPVVLEAE
jgi:hypothetical protein